PLEALLQEMLRPDPAARPTAAQARDRIPPPSAPTAQWSRAADGSLFVVADRLETAEAGPEVPLDGPGSLAGLAPGLHERLTALSASAGSPAAAPPTALSAAPPRPRSSGSHAVPLRRRRGAGRAGPSGPW